MAPETVERAVASHWEGGGYKSTLLADAEEYLLWAGAWAEVEVRLLIPAQRFHRWA